MPPPAPPSTQPPASTSPATSLAPSPSPAPAPHPHGELDGHTLLYDTDSYKVSHWLQYPPHTTRVFSYVESRGGRHPATVFFGLQYLVSRYLTRPVTLPEVEAAAKFWTEHGEPFNKDGWAHVVEKHGGFLPIRVRAAPEGAVVPTSNVLVTVENTCDECFWCTSWVETALLRVWYPTTVCTESRHIKTIIKRYLDLSSDPAGVAGELLYKLHDFGARGVSSQESACLGGAAHLVNFSGTDTAVAVRMLNRYYAAGMVGTSIPAAEHSTITAWGRDREEDAFRNMVAKFGKPGAIFAVVSDSYDIFAACAHLWGEKLKDQVVQSGAVLVVRPDSGVPHEVVLQVLQILDEKFGSALNTKGFKVLNYVRVIQGDGVDADSIERILKTATDAGFSASNVTFGMGGALLQKHHRDVQKFAMKCSHIVCEGKGVDVWKDPVGDKSKTSKRGRLDLVKTPQGGYETRAIPDVHAVSLPDSALVTVYENGKQVHQVTFTEVRERAAV